MKSFKWYSDIKNKLIDAKLKEIEALRSIDESGFEWSELKPMNHRHKGTGCIGVYEIWHKPTNTIKSIGQGAVSARKSRHIGVFRNNGETIISKNKTPNGSITGKKMYEYDRNEDNWFFRFLNVGDKSLSLALEEYFQGKIKPQFNASYMAGK